MTNSGFKNKSALSAKSARDKIKSSAKIKAPFKIFEQRIFI
ncbi:hypothetical protein J2772_001001 [Chryseobacterium jejuense]|nr:hypothetical protein [Chryseobacterium jejuense]